MVVEMVEKLKLNFLAKIIGGICIAIFILVIILISTTIIPAGYVGVIYNPLKNGVQNTILSQGFHFVNPISKVTKYTVATEQQYLSSDTKDGSRDDESFMVVTSDGKSVRVSIEYSVRFDSEKTPELFTRFRGQSGDQLLSTYVRGKVKTYVSEATSRYSVLDVYGAKRTEINASIYKHVKEKFAKDFIIIDSVNLTEVAVDTETQVAIQQRVTAQQSLEEEKIKRDKAVIVSEKLKIEAEGQANAEARSILIKADATAKANRIISASVDDKIIKLEEIKKWNGQKENTTLVNGSAVIGLK